MKRRQRRLVLYVGAFVGVVAFYTLLYNWAMTSIEGQSESLVQSLLVVIETFTTIGYGTDAGQWTSPVTIGLLILMQFSAVFFIFMALPLFASPWLEERFSTTPPTGVDLENHVIICSHTNRTRMLREELDRVDVETVVVETDRDLAVDLHRDGVAVVHGDPESARTLADANLGAARALVADVDDEANASIALAASEGRGVDTQLITFVEQPEYAEYHRYAGADHVFTPRTLIGESLAGKVTTAVQAGVGDAVDIGGDLEIVELPVQPDSDLAGRTIAESEIRERTGVNVVGAWFRGEFVSPPSPDATIGERTVLLVAGREPELEQLKELTLTDKRRLRSGPVLVGGLGEVGSTVREAVTAAGLDCRGIDRDDHAGVDIVGDVRDAETLRKAGLGEASIVVLALSDDTDAIFATLAIRNVDPDVEIIARANETDSVRKLYRAGADYVLALSTVSGRMLASTILGEEMLSYDQQVAVVRAPVGDLVGKTLADANIREHTGVTVVAVARDGELLSGLEPEFRFQTGDEAVVAGPDDAVTSFTALAGTTGRRAVTQSVATDGS
jgi:Trk K+ transport system NAD-binding subunit